MEPKFNWFDVLFNTQRYKAFKSHYTLLAQTKERLDSKNQELNRTLAAKDKQIRDLQNDNNMVRLAHDAVQREVTRLRQRITQQPVTVMTATPDQVEQIKSGRVTAKEKTVRYGEQYRGGQVQSTPVVDPTDYPMQAQYAAHVLISTGIDPDYADDSNRRTREEIPAYVQESRAEPVQETRSHTPRSDYEPSSDRSGGWSDSSSGDSGGSSGD